MVVMVRARGEWLTRTVAAPNEDATGVRVHRHHRQPLRGAQSALADDSVGCYRTQLGSVARQRVPSRPGRFGSPNARVDTRMPFTAEQFFDVFRRYNTSVWPMQWVLAGLGIAAVLVAFRRSRWTSGVVFAILAALWLWMALGYHLAFFASINRAAILFAALFIGQSGLFLWAAARAARFRFNPRFDVHGTIGGAIIATALMGYPLLSYAVGHRYPALPTFGLPCPTTMLTLGLLLWIEPPIPRRLAAIPVAWSIVGAIAAARLGAREDYVLLVSGLLTATVLLAANRNWRVGARWAPHQAEHIRHSESVY